MKLAIFDMDGTLVDSVALVVETISAAFAGVGQAVPDEKTIRSISGLTLGLAMQRLAPEADAERLALIVAQYRIEYLARGHDREPLFAGVREMLDRLRADPDTILAVATGKSLSGARRVLGRNGIEDYFSSIATPDDNPSKPHPQMILSAMRAAGVTANDAVMIGDTNHDMEMAKAAAVGAIGVGWGYHRVEALRAAGADLIVEKASELDGAIARLTE